MTKVRVYELARRYGMKGPKMAATLRDLGFEKIKSHMAVLDEADQMMVMARLEAQGLQAVAPAPGEATTAIDAPPKKKTLKKKTLEKKALPTAEAKPTLRKKPLPGGPTKTATGVAAAPPEPPSEAVEPEVAQTQHSAAAQATEFEFEKEKEKIPAEAASQATGTVEAEEALAKVGPVETTEAAVGEDMTAETQVGDATATEAPEPAKEVSAEEPLEEAEQPEETEKPKRKGKKTEQEAKKPVKQLIVPKAKAQVLRRIELPEATIRDATRRSAPGGARDPGGVDGNLRRAALQHTQSRSATRSGPGTRRGPMRSGPRGGRPRDSRGRAARKTPGSSMGLSTTIDPDKVIEIEPPISVKGLSEALGIKISALIAALTFKLGVQGKTINSFLSPDEVELVALEIGRNIKIVEQKEAEEELLETLITQSADETIKLRAPVITFMGHVDHGKTTLLDALRKSDIVKGESGGITQHIGAYKITTENGRQFVVLDTPGHAAFTAMRARGVGITDIVVLVVAADDGVMPQTEEAISHTLEANAQMLVAVNKCDAPGANPMQVRQQLAVKGLQPEEWGGKVQVVDVSAITGQGLDDLVEKILLEAEMLELRARPSAQASGVVIESRQSAEQGIVVNVLVTDGTLKLKDKVICGESYSRVRGLTDDHGRSVTEAGPSTPVSILGLGKLPMPGDKFFVVADFKKAKEVIDERQRRARGISLAERTTVTLENLKAQLAEMDVEEIKVILKADVMGSLEPIKQGLTEIGTSEVRINIIHTGLGAVTETDIGLAQASKAMIIGFNTVPDPAARQAADRAGVEIRHHSVIYELLDEMKLALEGLLKPEELEKISGHAEVRATFKSSKAGTIAGCYVLDGAVHRGDRVRLSRDGRVVYRGTVATLRRLTDDVREVKSGYECGLTLVDFNDVKEDDQLEFFSIEYIKRILG